MNCIMKNLKRAMVVALSALLLSSYANAQDVNRKWNAFIELQPIFSTADGASHSLNLQVGALKHIQRQLFDRRLGGCGRII